MRHSRPDPESPILEQNTRHTVTITMGKYEEQMVPIKDLQIGRVYIREEAHHLG
jgi:hypothetical protein